ncbi:MAG: nucleotide pyrophosphohydrolase [Candidatus Heimdallarchaeota archaeon]|nr:nucleotide pyrophosphohydrolase [Candidatus Heimdallarchaeota archaeon]
MNAIEEIQERIRQFIKAREWEEYHKPKNLAMSIAIEAAELMELFQWISVKTSQKRLDDPDVLQQLKDELADILIYSFSLANIADIDIREVMIDKLNRNETRFPPNKTYFY